MSNVGSSLELKVRQLALATSHKCTVSFIGELETILHSLGLQSRRENTMNESVNTYSSCYFSTMHKPCSGSKHYQES